MSEILYFIITIGILVFVHEFGHFAAAKLSGMRADVFAIGFGYRLFGYNKISGFSFGELPKDFDGMGNTDYRLCLLPLGGYVKIAGMIDESMDTSFAANEPQPYEFRAKSTSKKVFVITAGVLMNLFLSFAIFWGANFFYGKSFTKTTTVGYVEPGSAAEASGFRRGDKILQVNGKLVRYWEDVRSEIFVSGLGMPVAVVVERDGREEKLTIPRKLIPADETKEIYLQAEGLKPLISDILKGSAADSAGIKAGDVFLVLNDTTLTSVPQTIKRISQYPGTQMSLQLLRGKDTVSLLVTPGKDGKIGVLIGGYAFLGKSERVTYGFFASIGLGLQDIANMTGLTFTMMKRVITGDLAFGKAFGGPIKIAQYAAKSADSGIASFLMFLGLLSLSLAILNILPFPVLDGGHLVIILIEAAIKREIPIKVKVVVQNIGLGLLLLLMAFILYNDILGLK